MTNTKGRVFDASFKLKIVHIFMLDAAINMEDINRRGAQALDCNLGELLGQSSALLVPPRFLQIDRADRARFAAQLMAGSCGRGELFCKHKDGREVPMEVSVFPLQGAEGLEIAVTFVENTEHGRTFERLVEERELLRQVLDINPNLLFVKNEQGRYLVANPAVARFFGIPVERLIGKTDAEIGREVGAACNFRGLDFPAPEAFEDHILGEVQVTDIIGNERWLHVVMRKLPSRDHSPVGVVCCGIDITDRKRTELELSQQRSELAHLSRVMMLGEMSGSLAHELNQPLTAILSNAQAALRFTTIDDFDPDELRSILHDIVDDDRRATKIISGLHLLLKKGGGANKPSSVNRVVQDVLKLVHSHMLNAGVTISTELVDPLPDVCVDRVQLQQVLINLVMNASDAMSTVTKDKRKLVIRTVRDSDSSVEISVSDSGHGVAVDAMPRVFEPFFTSKPQGLGLGLTICHKIIRASGGLLQVENLPAGGARFWFSLPCDNPNNRRNAA
jgi:signal transduction histidine kinase